MTIGDRILELSPLTSGTLGEHLAAITVGTGGGGGYGTNIKGNINRKHIPSTMQKTQKLSATVNSGNTAGKNEKTQKISGNINKKIIR